MVVDSSRRRVYRRPEARDSGAGFDAFEVPAGEVAGLVTGPRDVVAHGWGSSRDQGSLRASGPGGDLLAWAPSVWASRRSRV